MCPRTLGSLVMVEEEEEQTSESGRLRAEPLKPHEARERVEVNLKVFKEGSQLLLVGGQLEKKRQKRGLFIRTTLVCFLML